MKINPMKINWKERIRSGPFWMGLISAVVSAVFTIIPMCGVELPVGIDQVMQAATLILMIPVALGVISDPTTKGLSDSARALTYDKPADNVHNTAKQVAAAIDAETDADTTAE